jgi:cell division protein FtsQ
MKKLKKFLRTLMYLALFGGLISAFAVANKDYSSQTIIGAEVDIANANRFHFLDADMVLEHLKMNGMEVSNQNIDAVDVLAIRHSVRQMPAVKQADVFRSVDGRLRIRIEQRTPLCRILNADGSGFYLDEDGRVMPLSQRYTAHVLVIAGHLSESMNQVDIQNVTASSESAERSLLDDIFRLAVHIEDDAFLRDLVEHVVVNADNEFELVPRIGDLRIRIGSSRFLDVKTKKLKLFYAYALKNLNLNYYSRIDLRFRKQVVCTRRANV